MKRSFTAVARSAGGRSFPFSYSMRENTSEILILESLIPYIPRDYKRVELRDGRTDGSEVGREADKKKKKKTCRRGGHVTVLLLLKPAYARTHRHRGPLD